MKTVRLTEAAIQAIRNEAMGVLTGHIAERFTFRGEKEGEERERQLLATADVIAALEPTRLEFSEMEGSTDVNLTDEAIGWMRQLGAELRQHLEHLDRYAEGTLQQCGEDAYRVWVMDRILREVAS